MLTILTGENTRDLRKEIRTLGMKFKSAITEDRIPLAKLLNALSNILKNLRRTEWHKRRMRKERTRKGASFIPNPFGFATSHLGDKRSGILETS